MTDTPAKVLRDCPFCGNTGIDDDEGCFPLNTQKTSWAVRCGNPSCFAEVGGGTREQATAAWNRRA